LPVRGTGAFGDKKALLLLLNIILTINEIITKIETINYSYDCH